MTMETRPGDMTRTSTTDASTTASEAAGTVTEQVSDVAGATRAQVQSVAGDARDHAASLVEQARTEVRSQVDARGHQLASTMHGLASQVHDLRSGRAGEAGSLDRYLVEAEQRLDHWATRIDDAGPQAALADLRAFARDRPAVLLFGAAAAGFVAGRLARAGGAAHHDAQHDARQPSDGRATAGSSPAAGPYDVRDAMAAASPIGVAP